MYKYDIVCIGLAIMDSIIKGFEPEPVSATGFRAESGSLNVGGDAVNESIASAKLGMKTAILCSLGRDFAGDIILEELERYGVNTELVVRSAEHPTPVTTIFVTEDGNRKSITNSAHNYNFHPEQYMSRFTGTRAVMLGSLFRAPFNDPDVIMKVVSAAADRDAIVFADTKLPNFRKLSLDDISHILPEIDFITPNEDEGKYYTGKDSPEEMADVFLEKGAQNVIIKLGGRGCFFKNHDLSVHVPAYRIDTIDATGAGDNFIAGFASEIIKGSTAGDALRFASACGAICSTAVGAGAAVRNRDQVLKFLADKK